MSNKMPIEVLNYLISNSIELSCDNVSILESEDSVDIDSLYTDISTMLCEFNNFIFNYNMSVKNEDNKVYFIPTKINFKVIEDTNTYEVYFKTTNEGLSEETTRSFIENFVNIYDNKDNINGDIVFLIDEEGILNKLEDVIHTKFLNTNVIDNDLIPTEQLETSMVKNNESKYIKKSTNATNDNDVFTGEYEIDSIEDLPLDATFIVDYSKCALNQELKEAFIKLLMNSVIFIDTEK